MAPAGVLLTATAPVILAPVVPDPESPPTPASDAIEPYHCSLEVTLTQLSNLNRAKCKESGWALVCKMFVLGTDRWAETSKVLITSLSQALEQKLTLPITIASCQDIDSLVYYPLLINFYESITVLAKDKKKQPEEKLELLGQVTVDALPLVHGSVNTEDALQGRWTIFPTVPQTAADAAAEPSQCELLFRPNSPIVPAELRGKFNVMTVNVHSCHSFPEAWMPNPGGKAPSIGFTIATALPRTAYQKRLLVASNKQVVAKCSPLVLAWKRWPVHPAIISEAIYRQEKMQPKSYLTELGDFCDPNNWIDRHEVERNQPCVAVNTEFRCVLSEDAEKLFRSNAIATRILPFEIFEVTHLEAKHAGIKKKGNTDVASAAPDEPIMTRHGAAFVNLKPLLYPGATRISGAYFIKSFESSQFIERTKHASLGTEIVKTSASCVQKGPEKIEPPRLSVASKKVLDHGPSHSDHHGAKTVLDPTAGLHVEPDSQLYNTCKTYLYLEITLDKPLIEKTIHVEVIDRLKELIAPTGMTGPVEAHPGEAAETVLDEQMDAMYQHFAHLFLDEKNRLSKKRNQTDREDGFIESRGDADRIRQQMEQRLTDSGDFHALKEQLKLNTARLVREKHLLKQPFQNPLEYDRFLADLYDELAQHAQFTFNTTKRHCQVPPRGEAKPKDNPQHLRILAMEAETDEDFSKALFFLSERTDIAPNNPSCWQDLGLFHIRRGRILEAEDALRQMLLDNFTNFNGLLLNGYVQMEREDWEKAATYFEAAVLIYPDSALAWCALGLFNEIRPVEDGGSAAVLTERAFAEAKRASVMEENRAKKYELFLAAVVQQEAAAAAAAPPPELTPKNQQHTPINSTVPSRPKTGSKAAPKKDVKIINQAQADTEKQRVGEQPRLETIFHNLNAVFPAKPKHDIPAENIFWCAISSFANLGMHKMTNACAEHLIAGRCDLLDPVFWRATVLSYIEQGHYRDADAFLQKLLVVDVETADIFAIAGHVEFLCGHYQKAAEHYRRALFLTTEVSDPFALYLRYGRLSEMHGHWKKAKEMFYRAAKLFPSCRTWLGCGRACYNLGEDELAEAALQEANYLDNRDAQVWGCLTLLNVRRGEAEVAERCYQAAKVFSLASYPDLAKEVDRARASMKEVDQARASMKEVDRARASMKGVDQARASMKEGRSVA
ncbi:putative Cilia- and flagella-associated protein 70 [Hypsibius exemplaris]|uniref:Cilia- and flagella-associated protein 70 n=1 Tax=Hypsibius exemplaris TaxID=2072580 RepID=A0A1W0X185_HYPEX|nr:putative Cilia- and flagella-associated protein 70 [Hypsibius exemplaris]